MQTSAKYALIVTTVTEVTERKEDLIEQFTTLNSTCFVRSTTEVKERSRRSSENGIFNLLYFFF